MNIKIQAEGVVNLLGADYEKRYIELQKGLEPRWAEMFAPRRVGNGYLEWVLDDDGWMSVDEGYSLVSAEARRIYEDMCRAVSARFGANVKMAAKVLSVPDDSFIYYRTTPEGDVQVRLAAWGYQYPIRPTPGGIDVDKKPKVEREPVKVTILDNGRPVAKRTFLLNGMKRVTDENGEYIIGAVEVGTPIDIRVEGFNPLSTIVAPGNGQLNLDITRFCDIRVKVVREGEDKPLAGQTVDIEYNGQTATLTTDDTGYASWHVALSSTPTDVCSAVCDTRGASIVPAEGQNEMTITLPMPVVDPPAEEKKEEEEKKIEEEKKEEEKKEEPEEEPKKEEDVILPPEPPKMAVATVSVVRDGQPVGGQPVVVTYAGDTLNLTTDAQGTATIRLTIPNDNPTALCSVAVDSQTLERPLVEEPDGENIFEFELESLLRPCRIEVNITRYGEPLPNKKVDFTYGAQTMTLVTDAAGYAETTIDVDPNNLGTARASIAEGYLEKPLELPATAFGIDIVDANPGWKTYLVGALLALILAGLTALTFWLCNKELFSFWH